ncbi:MAG: hypothetical protein H7Z14_09690 [Anaerolineae bacterium]|nr:hypothetical protein [Phycisphaerae bacterium]
MTLDEARQAIRDAAATYAAQVEASAVISGSKQAELSELIRCLRMGGHPAEIAATALYTRTGRPYSGRITEFSTSANEWLRYLAQQVQLAAS